MSTLPSRSGRTRFDFDAVRVAEHEARAEERRRERRGRLRAWRAALQAGVTQVSPALLDMAAERGFDLGRVVERLRPPVGWRPDVVEVGRPEPEHFDVVLDGLVAGMAARWGVPTAAMPELPRRAEATLRDALARWRSVRLLKRQVEDVVSALVAGPRRNAH